MRICEEILILVLKYTIPGTQYAKYLIIKASKDWYMVCFSYVMSLTIRSLGL